MYSKNAFLLTDIYSQFVGSVLQQQRFLERGRVQESKFYKRDKVNILKHTFLVTLRLRACLPDHTFNAVPNYDNCIVPQSHFKLWTCDLVQETEYLNSVSLVKQIYFEKFCILGLM